MGRMQGCNCRRCDCDKYDGCPHKCCDGVNPCEIERREVRRLVLVEIDSPTPLDAEFQVAFALAEAGLKGTYVRQTNVVLASATEAGVKHDG